MSDDSNYSVSEEAFEAEVEDKKEPEVLKSKLLRIIPSGGCGWGQF